MLGVYLGSNFLLSNNPFYYHHSCVSPNQERDSHWHDHMEIILFEYGEGGVEYCGHDGIHTVYNGDIAVCNAGEVHSLHMEHGTNHHYCLYMHRDILKDFGIDVGLVEFDTIIRDEEITRRFLRIKDLLWQPNDAPVPHKTKMIAKAETLSLIAMLYKDHSQPRSLEEMRRRNEKQILVHEVISYIQKHLSEKITLDDICEHVNFSRSYMCYVFREYTGKSIVETINVYRCRYARGILQEKTRLSVSEVATLSGFTNTAYFTKVYHEYYKETPSDTRRRIR